MRIFGSDRLKNLMTSLGMQEGEVIQHPWVSKSIERAQKAVESHNFDIRKHLLEYDDVMNKQREVIYRERNRVLRQSDIRSHMLEILDDVSVLGVEAYMPEKKASSADWDLDGLKKWFFDITKEELSWTPENLHLMDRDSLSAALKDELVKAYGAKEQALTPEVTRRLERAVILEVVDNQWKDHLLSMDHLKEGIGLQAYGQKDPLIEYKREGFAMFQEMVARVKEESLRLLFMVKKVESPEELFGQEMPSHFKEEHPDFDPHAAAQQPPRVLPPSGPMSMLGGGAPPAAGMPMGGQPWEMPQGGQPQGQPQKVATIRREEPKVGRNDPCWCGSGKKFKKCHGA
jgi:preprotein translocase subunit SecA